MGAGCGPNVSDLYDNESPRLVAYGSFLSARERLSRFYVHASVLRAYERQERSSNECTCSFKINSRTYTTRAYCTHCINTIRTS